MKLDPTVVASIVAGLATIVGAVMSLLSRRLIAMKMGPVEIEFKGEGPPPPDLDRDSRLTEARQALSRQGSIAKWNKRANAWLTFSQYVIGGVLATSFMQNALSKEVVGFLGVLVLLSKLIHQHYRPDVSFRAAQRRSVQLKRLIRGAEDEVFTIKQEMEGAPSILDVRTRVSNGLSDIEEEELAETGEESRSGENAEQALPADADKPRR